MATSLTKKMKLTQITQTAQRSQAVFIEDVKKEPGQPRGGKIISVVTDDPKDLQGFVIDKVYTITIS
jgi:hypothetical protein